MKDRSFGYDSPGKIFSLVDETRFTPGGIVSRTLLQTEVSRLVLFGFSEGQELTEHTASQHAFVQILSGECEFELAGKLNHLKTGDLVYMPPGAPHSLKATTQCSMLLTLSKAPPAAPKILPPGRVNETFPGSNQNQ